MPAAVTHFIIAMLLIRLFASKFLKIKETRELRLISFIGGLAGLLPDADFLVFYIKKIFALTFSISSLHIVHRTLTHSLVFALFFLVLALLFYKKKRIFTILLVLSLGITIHIGLDFFTANNLVLFYPFSEAMSGINLIPGAYYYQTRLLVSIDALIFVAWISWLFYKNKLTDFV